MKTKCFIILFIPIFFSLSLFAQPPTKGIAGGGPRGIYVHLGNNLLSSSHPMNGAVGYQIERKKKGEKNWSVLADLKSASSQSEFITRFEESAALVPYPMSSSEVPLTNLWERIEKWHIADSLHSWLSVLQVRLALGITYCDTTAVLGVKYEYRISKMSPEKKPTIIAISQPVIFPQQISFPKIKSVSKKIDQFDVEIRWGIGAGRKPATFEVFRKDALGVRFHSIKPIRLFLSGRDSLFLIVRDTTVAPKQNYAYFISPCDMYGNKGSNSDTVVVASTTLSTIPVPDQIRTESLDTLGGIQLRWRVSKPDELKSVRIFRSEEWEKGFRMISALPPTDSLYIDQTVQPMMRYYYYLTITNSLDEESPPTARVIGLFKSAAVPIPPTNIHGQALKNGVRLEWNACEDVLGFYVFRGTGRHIPMTQISPLIPLNQKEMKGSFVDTSTTLSGKISYAYSVRAESKSHIAGGFSDTLIIRPLIHTVPLTPVKLTIVHDGNSVRLYWQDMRSNDETIQGYHVYRRLITDRKVSEFKIINDTLLPATKNYFVDRIEEGTTCEYAVRSLDIFGGQSTLSSPQRIGMPVHIPSSPAGIRIEKGNQGIVIRWDPVKDPEIVSFKILRTKYQGKEAIIGTVKSDTLEFVDKTAKSGQLYFYKIMAVAKNGRTSNPTKELSVRP